MNYERLIWIWNVATAITIVFIWWDIILGVCPSCVFNTTGALRMIITVILINVAIMVSVMSFCEWTMQHKEVT